MDALPFNFEIMRHWENWVIITLMVLISCMAVDIFIGDVSKTPNEDAI